MSLAAKQQQMIDDLLLIEDPQERLAAVVDRARGRPPLGESERSEANRVRACISAAWLVGTREGTACRFRGDADSPLVRGLVTLLCDLYDGAPADEIAAVEPTLLAASGLERTLSPTRLNGLRGVRARIRDFAAGAAS